MVIVLLRTATAKPFFTYMKNQVRNVSTDCVGSSPFAFMTSKRQLFAARDRIGEKTLYYAQIPGGVVFSTELKAILKNYISKPQVNLHHLAAPIRYTCPLHPSDTFIEQIKRLEPGHYILVEETGISKLRYWKRFTEPSFTGTRNEAKQETLRLMQESVDISLRSDVPVAVMLSGGIDSSTIAALAKETGREVHTITAGYEGNHECDERATAKKFAYEKGLIYHEIVLDEKDFRDCFEEFTIHIDEPITDSAALAQWALCKKTKELGFKVLLGGMGGDELFYGYPYWNDLAKSLKIHRQHQSLFPWNSFQKKINYLRFLSQNLKYLLIAGYPLQIRDSRFAGGCIRISKFANKLALSIMKCFTGSRRRSLLFIWKLRSWTKLDLVYGFSFDYIMTMAYLYLSDREGMANSIEIRSPFLDYKLVEFVSSLPQNFKYSEGQHKCFMKQVIEGLVPEYIINSTKRLYSTWKFYQQCC